MSHFILVAILVYSLVPGEAQSSDPPAAQDNSTLLIGVSAYDPYLNRDIIFATPMGTKLVTAESRLYFVDFGDRRYTSIQLNPPDMGLTTMEFDPGTSGLLATCATPGHPAYFGSVNLTSGECLPKATLPSHVKIKIGVSAYDDQRQMYFMSARERGSFDDGDVILRIQGKKQYKVDILKATFGPNSIFELVQLSINPKYYGVEVSQAVALNVIYADKQSGWQQMMVDFGEAESPSQSPTGIAVQNRASRRKNVTAEHLGDLSSTNVDWETMYTELTMNNEDFQKTPVPIQSGLSMYVQTETELSNFISSDPLGPFEAPEFVPGFPQLLSNAENLDGYNFKIKMIRICRVVIGAINMDQMIRQNKMPTKDAMISIASAGTTAFDFYRGGVTADVRDPAQAIAMSISNLPCNTNLRLFYLTRFGEKAESDVTEWRPSGMNRLMCKQGQFCPNTDDGKVENSPCTLCLPGTYQPYNNTLAGRCFICPYGFVTSLGGQKECTACAPGKYTGSSRVTCSLCEIGKFADNRGSGICKICAAGYVTNRRGQQACTSCPPGTYSGNSTTECTQCPMGYFSSSRNSTQCTKCPIGQITVSLGSSICVTEQLVMGPPTNLRVKPAGLRKLCIKFEPPPKESWPQGIKEISKYIIAYSTKNQFTLSSASNQFVANCTSLIECEVCLEQGIPLHLSKSYIRVTAVVMGNLIGALSAPSNGWITAGECGDTRYLDNNSSMLQDWQCVNCPAGGDCSGDILWDGVRAQFGYYRLGEEDRDLESKRYYQPCINPKACLGGENKMLEGSFFDSDENDMALQNSREVCNYDLGFETHCPQFNLNSSSAPRGCRLCRACRRGYWEQGVADCSPCPPKGLDIIASIVATGVLAAFVYSFYKTSFEEYREDLVVSRLHFAQTLKKIVLNHLQLVSLASAFPLQWPKAVSEFFRFLEVLGTVGDVIFNPSCSSSAKTNTMFYEKQAFILCLPLVCIGLMGVGIVYVGISNRVEKQKSDRKKRQIQQRLKKRGLGSGLDSSGAKKKEREEKKRKNEALSNSLRAKKSAKVSPLKIVKKQQKKNKKFVLPLTTFDKFTSMMVTFLYLVYPSLCKATFTLVSCRKVGINWYLQMDMDLLCNSPDHISWVVVLFLPGLLLYVIGLPLAAFFYLRRHRRVINDPKMKFKFGVLFAGYRYGHSSWECVIALRKATIIFVSIVLAGAGAGPQALLAVLAILLFALWHMQAKPFIRVLDKEDILDSAESIALLVTLITLWTGLFFFQEIPRIGTLPAFLSTALLIFNLAFLTMLLRWWLIFFLMDIHTKRRTLSAGLHRSGCEGRMMQLMERFLPSLISRKDAKWKHARVKILAVARMIIHFKRIRERVAAGEQAAFRAHHVGKRNLLKLNLLPHRKTIEEQRTRMAAIERLKGTILPMAKEQKFQTPRNATRVVPKGVLSGRRTPTRIYPMGIPSPSLGRLTPTDSRPGSTQSRSGSRLSRPGSKSRRRSPESEGKQKSPKLTQLVPAKTAFKGKNRQQQAAMMKIIAAKKLKQRQKALEKAEAERERLKKDPEWQKKDIKRKLNLAVDTQFVAKQGLKAMIEGESRRLQQEKSKLRAQMEKLMQLGKSRKLTPPQVAKLKETLSQLKKKYESLIQKEKVLALKSKHV